MVSFIIPIYDRTDVLRQSIKSALNQTYQHIEVILITKSLVENLDEFLKKYCLFGLFDEVIWLKEIENKEDHMRLNSIFIDDSFSQRMAVSKKLNIPTFDPSMLETLIDKKI